MMARPMVTIEVNERQLRELQRTLGGFSRRMPLIVSRSLNRTIKKAKVDTSRAIRSEVRLKVGDIKKGIRIKQATRSRWIAIMSLTKRRFPLIKFAARQLKKGVSYAIKRSGGRRRIRMGFRKTMPGRGHRGIFRRKRKTTPRLPIVELFGPSIASVFQGGVLNRIIGRSRVSRKIKKLIQINLAKYLTQQIDYSLKKRGT